MSTLYHGGQSIIEFPKILAQLPQKDFSWGFYCTYSEEQAVRWATRFGSPGIVNVYSFDTGKFLRTKRFPGMTEEWLDFVATCRSGASHPYDVVDGPMADDTIAGCIQDYLDGKIDREDFWKLAKFEDPAHQVCFHTEAALGALKWESSYVASTKES